MVAVAIIGAGAIGAGAQMFGASQAADAQTQAAQAAQATQMGMFNKTQANLQPYMAFGQQGANALSGQMAGLTAPIKMDQATLEQTPGYQWNLGQGLKSTQNSAAARGLGTSGAALKGAATYATGLADSTYQNQFNNAQTNRQTTYNMLMGQAGLGENAAAGLGNNAVQTGQGIANAQMGAGNAQAAAWMAGGNALAGGINGGLNSWMQLQALQGQGGMFGMQGTGG